MNNVQFTGHSTRHYRRKAAKLRKLADTACAKYEAAQAVVVAMVKARMEAQK